MAKSTFNSKQEEDLIAAAMQGNQACVGELYRRYFPKVVSRCLSISKDKAAADDLAQDIFLKTLEKMPTFKHQALFSTWLYAITTNHCLEYLRKTKRHQTVSLEESQELNIADEPEEDAHHQHEMLQEQLRGFLQGLPQEDRSLLLLKYSYNRSIRELQRSHPLSTSAIKMRLKRLKRKLAYLLSKEKLLRK